jgi:hypothetical protein
VDSCFHHGLTYDMARFLKGPPVLRECLDDLY